MPQGASCSQTVRALWHPVDEAHRIDFGLAQASKLASGEGRKGIAALPKLPEM